MAFPSNPTNGQTTTINRVNYVYSNVYNTWTVNNTATYTGVSGRSNITATAGQTSFPVVYQPGAVNVFLNGLLLDPSDYTSTSGTAIVLANAALAGSILTVETFAPVSFSYQTRTYTGNAVANTFAVSSGLTANNVLVSLNGLLQVANVDYTVNSGVVTFTTAPAADQNIQIRELPA